MGRVVVGQPDFTTVLPASLPSGTYEVRVIVLSASGQPVGTFSDAVAVVVP